MGAMVDRLLVGLKLVVVISSGYDVSHVTAQPGGSYTLARSSRIESTRDVNRELLLGQPASCEKKTGCIPFCSCHACCCTSCTGQLVLPALTSHVQLLWWMECCLARLGKGSSQFDKRIDA